jgi:hypothetical protein
MTHGTRRNTRRETEYGEPVTLVDDQGRLVYRGPLSARTQTVEERWCATCEQWHTIRGILGVLLGCPRCQADW